MEQNVSRNFANFVGKKFLNNYVELQPKKVSEVFHSV